MTKLVKYEGPDQALAERDPLERRDPLRRLVQAGNEVKLAAAGREEGLARGDADFLQRLKAVGNESGADDVYPFRSGLGHGDQRRLRIRLQPLGEAEARLERRAPRACV